MIHNFNDQHIHLLVNAFQNDPMFIKLFKGSSRHRQMSAFFKFIYMRNQLMHGMYLTDSSDTPSYVAFIETPKSKRKYSLINMIQLIIEMIRLVFYIPIKSLNFLSRYDAITLKERPREDHYYLTMIAVCSKKQGHGVGKRVINIIHQIAIDNLDVPNIRLDTEYEKNVSYYEHLGYKLKNQVEVSNLIIYCMEWKKF